MLRSTCPVERSSKNRCLMGSWASMRSSTPSPTHGKGGCIRKASALLVVAVACLGVTACKPRPTPETVATQPEKASLPPVVTAPPRPTVLETSPEQMRTALVNAYRLKPDARFLGAIREVHHFLTGQPYGSVEVEFVD